MSLWRTIYRAGGQFSARPAPALIRQSQGTEVRRGKLKLAPPEEMNGERERGSALLIVFLMAAFVAIMLYKEMPDVVFEAQRQKEQVLIDRGDEYKHAIKLFYRRNQRFPTALDQLDKFNNVRYIRHQFKDPLTGKDEWRLIHVSGPGFVLTDSKVAQPKVQLGQSGASAFGSSSTSSTFGSSSTPSTFGSSNTSSTFGSPDSGTFGSPTETETDNEQPGGTEPAALARRRAPEAPANTFGAAPQNDNDENADQVDEPDDMSERGADTQQQDSQMGGGVPAPNGMSAYGTNPAGANTLSENGQVGRQPQGMQPQGMQPRGMQPQGMQPQGIQPQGMQPQGMQPQGMQPQGMQPQGMQPQGMQPQGMQPQGMQPQGMQPQGAQSAGLAAINNALRQPGPTRAGTGSSMGTMFAAGSIAGIASKGKGKSIKVVDKQTDYSKWEFVYNPQKEAAAKMNAAMPSPTANGQNPASSPFFSRDKATTPSPSTNANNPSQ